MKKTGKIISLIGIAMLLIFAACKKEPVQTQPVITLSSYSFTGLSYINLPITVTIAAPNGISSLIMTKGVNLVTDSTFGTNGQMVLNASGDSLVYVFNFVLSPNDVGKLVGFNFKVTDKKGLSSQKDFTLHTTPSPRQILSTYRWNLNSVLWETAPAEETITSCQSDDSWLFYADSTLKYDYGQEACTYDGFNVYDKWVLSSDNDSLSITYHNVFNSAQITTDTYQVITLNQNKMVLDIYLDLSAFGLTNHELFQYSYVAAPLQ